MIVLHKLLYAVIKNWEIEERLRRDDFAFDAYEFLSIHLGHKNSSTLRKMCEADSGNGAKLGFRDAWIIMSITKDYRLLEWLKQKLIESSKQPDQLDLFSRPLRSLKDLQ